MIYIVKKIKPNVSMIKSLRKSINCTQSALLEEMKSAGYEMSRRTYQKIEKGDLTQNAYLEALIKFYTNRLGQIKICYIFLISLSLLLLFEKNLIKKNLNLRSPYKLNNYLIF